MKEFIAWVLILIGFFSLLYLMEIIDNVRQKHKQKYIRITYSKNRIYDQDKAVGQKFNEIA